MPDVELILSVLPALANGAVMTLIISAIAGLLALALGAILAALRESRWALLRTAALFYIDAMRGIPPFVLLLITFYLLPSTGLLLDPPTTGVVALAAYYCAYVAEVVRGALHAVPGGQCEAALTVGMTRSQIARRITIPQALGLMLPPLGGLMIGLVKESALLSVISVSELTFEAKQAVSLTYAPFEIYALAAAGYWTLTLAIEASFRFMERRVTHYRAASPDQGEGR